MRENFDYINFSPEEDLDKKKEERNLPKFKREKYQEMLGFEEKNEDPDVILVLDAGVAEQRAKGEKSPRWMPTSYEDGTANFPSDKDKENFRYGVRVSSRGRVMIGAAEEKPELLPQKNF